MIVSNLQRKVLQRQRDECNIPRTMYAVDRAPAYDIFQKNDCMYIFYRVSLLEHSEKQSTVKLELKVQSPFFTLSTLYWLVLLLSSKMSAPYFLSTLY